MKHLVLAISAFLLPAGVFAEPVSSSEFEPVLEIKRPGDEDHRLELAPRKEPARPAVVAEPTPAAAAQPAIPLIGSAAATAAPGEQDSVSRPLERYETLQKAASLGVDPLNLRTTTAVVSDDPLAKFDERSILQVAKDEWAKVKGMTSAERIQWAKENPAVPGGILAFLVVLLAFLVTLFKRR